MARRRYAVQTIEQARRTGRALVAWEQTAGGQDRGGEHLPRTGYVLAARVTTAITAKTSGQAGTGQVKILDVSETGALSLASDAEDRTCWNMGGAIALGRDINVAFGTRGLWAIVDQCP
jgi:hypothetical protein